MLGFYADDTTRKCESMHFQDQWSLP
jgi:hypothetical protein